MGASGSSLTKKDLADYEELTYFTRKEIIHVNKRFRELCDRKHLALEDGNTKRIKLPARVICERLPELKMNPFKDRICTVFSSQDDSTLIFDDFLDMMSVLSDNAPKKVKVEYAFRIFDFDDDDMIGEGDLKELIRRLAGKHQKFTDEELKRLCQNIFKEADLDDDEHLSFAEFEHVISKSPDFMNSFRIRL